MDRREFFQGEHGKISVLTFQGSLLKKETSASKNYLVALRRAFRKLTNCDRNSTDVLYNSEATGIKGYFLES